MNMHTKLESTAGIREEFIKVVQGCSTLYRFGSDRVRNKEHYIRQHAAALVDFSSPEFHPDSNRENQNIAKAHIADKSKGWIRTALADLNRNDIESAKVSLNHARNCLIP
jgi:hypothetical protein